MAIADNGSTYAVEVVNFYGSASAAATLTVRPVPRAPNVGDLRFQYVALHLFGFPCFRLSTFHRAIR